VPRTRGASLLGGSDRLLNTHMLRHCTHHTVIRRESRNAPHKAFQTLVPPTTNVYFWYLCNFPKLKIYHYNLLIRKYTITTSSFTDPYHPLRLPGVWAHCQTYIYCASFCMDDFASAKCQELLRWLTDVWDPDVRLSSTSCRPGSQSTRPDTANSAHGEQAAADASPASPSLHSAASLHRGGGARADRSPVRGDFV
jgi:hypothetical protein